MKYVAHSPSQQQVIEGELLKEQSSVMNDLQKYMEVENQKVVDYCEYMRQAMHQKKEEDLQAKIDSAHQMLANVRESGVEALIFADAGQVYNNIIKDISSLPFNFCFGAGIRFYNIDGTIAKIEFGRSRDGFRIYFVLNE